MAVTTTYRPTREWPLLVLAVAIVSVISMPLRQWLLAQPVGTGAERLGRLLLGPEQIACYCAFTWAGFILLSRYLEIRRQRRAFNLDLLSTDVGVCILPEDARLLKRKVEQATARGGPYILANMLKLALS